MYLGYYSKIKNENVGSVRVGEPAAKRSFAYNGTLGAPLGTGGTGGPSDEKKFSSACAQKVMGLFL
jgi:hypothetical protein